jgi:hypothetical protein
VRFGLRGDLSALFALFAVSGFTGLVYESVWSHSSASSRRTRLAVGWAFVILIVGFFVALALGWIEVLPG